MRHTFLVFVSVILALNILGCKKESPVVDPKPSTEDTTKTDTTKQDTVPAKPSRPYTQCRGYITSQYHDFVWEGKKPTLEVYVVNPNSYDTIVPLKMTIQTCNVNKKEIVDTITQMVRIKSKDSMAVYISPSKSLDPDIYRVSMTLDKKAINTQLLNWDGKTKKNAKQFNIAVDPTLISSPYDGQGDFDQFWDDTKRELRALYKDYEVKLTKVGEGNGSTIYFFEAQSIKLKSDDSGMVRGYYSEPNAEGKYPCYIQFPGYDTPGQAFSCPLWGNASACEMHVSPRGQYANAQSPYKNEYGEWIKYGIESKETYYYRGAFMDAVRAVDFAFAREKVDTMNVFLYGSSQGGALSLAAAALSDHDFAAISPCVPFLGDWPDFFNQSNGFPVEIRSAAKAKGMSDADALRVLSYIDTKNLAHKITCPVLEFICLQDEVVPPHTNASIYTNLTNSSDRDVLHISPLENHAWAIGWDDARNAFFSKYKR